MRAQRLEAGLNASDARLGQQPELLSAQIGLDLIKELVTCVTLYEFRKQLFEVRHVEDVVDRLEVAASVSSRLLSELVKDALWRLRPEMHYHSIQAAERAVVLRSPPASSGGLDREFHVAISRRQ